MSANSNIPRITCPSSLVASCAPLLGFQPRDCVVAFVTGVPGRPAPVVVRMDLPYGSAVVRVAETLASSIAGTEGRLVDLVAWVDAEDDTVREDLPSDVFLELMMANLEARGLFVGAVLSTNGAMWWSHACPDALCCGLPSPLEEDVMTAVQAEYVYAGVAPLASRGELGERICTDPARADRVAELVGADRSRANVERWQEAQIRFLSELLVPGWRHRSGATGRGVRTRAAGTPVDPGQAARAVRGLRDIAVRDVVLHRFINAHQGSPDAWRTSLDLLCDLVRCAPATHLAPPATLLAIVAWMRGDGALANVALDRAVHDEPDYTLADLTRQVITRGLDPNVWRETMGRLTEQQCRRGPQPPPRGRQPTDPSAPTR